MTGIGHHAANLLSALATTHSDVQYTALCAEATADRPWASSNVRSLPVRVTGPLWEQLELPTLLQEHEIDVYHNPAFGLPVVKTTRLVCTVHDCIPRLFPQYAPGWLRDFFEHWAPSWLRLADHIICVSEHTRHDITHLYGIDPAKTTVIYQTANAALGPVEPSERVEAVKRRLGIDAPYVLCVGRVELRKNVAGMLEAFRLLRSRSAAPLMLVLAGPRDDDAYDPQGILPPVGRSGDVLVTGYVSSEDLAALYSGCEVFCFPSFYEGFGIPIVEAMQCGAPVVTSRVSSMPEIGGSAGRYVDPYDPQSIAETIAHVMADRDLRDQMVAAGLHRARDFSPGRFAAETEAAYRRTAGVA
jgi:glycosyltransferase involved in cell wall biosynthesis